MYLHLIVSRSNANCVLILRFKLELRHSGVLLLALVVQEACPYTKVENQRMEEWNQAKGSWYGFYGLNPGTLKVIPRYL